MSRTTTPRLPVPEAENAATSDLTIDFSLHGFVIWKGTRAQLEADGLVPKGATWPHGFDYQQWEADGWRFYLSRRRPDGAKGPRKAFERVDNWHLKRHPVGGDSYVDVMVREKRRELERAIFEASDAGAICRMLACERSALARGDKRFRAWLDSVVLSAR